MTSPQNDAPVIAGDPSAIIPKLSGLKPGEALVYHTGNLAPDREFNLDRDILSNTIQIAERAMRLSDEGKVHLTQRRHLSENGFPYYEYIATGAL